MSRARIAVMQFPGLNCETESVLALEKVGVDAALVRWNEPPSRLAEFAGYFVPGGWSYQDRVRAGSIAAKASMMDELSRQAEKGKPVPMNIDGATAVIFAELGCPPPLARGLFCLSRSVGILAHAWEQMQQGGRNKGPTPPEYRWTYDPPDGGL